VSAAAIQLASLETFGHGLDHPEGICATPDGTVYVGGEAGRV
jgi:strictosidine synthase-like protein